MVCSYYYTWCDIILIFKLHRRTRLTPGSSIHSLKIRMTSHPCNEYEHTTLSNLLSVKYKLATDFVKSLQSALTTYSVSLTFSVPTERIIVNCSNLIIEMHLRFVLRRENVPRGKEIFSRWVKTDRTDFNFMVRQLEESSNYGF